MIKPKITGLLIYLLGINSLFFIPQQVLSQTQFNSWIVEQSESLIGKKELTSLEKYRVTRAINQLKEAATNKLNQGNQDQAFELWYRQLKLNNLLSVDSEIKALGEIGAIAWKLNRSGDVRYLAEHLIKIENKITTQEQLQPEILDNLAFSYRQVRYLDKAINIYQNLLARLPNNTNSQQKQTILKNLGELYLAIFDYQNASVVYQKLLNSNNKEQREDYLNTLIKIYDQTDKPRKAIALRKNLIQNYIITQKPNKIPAIKLAIANNYQTLKQINQAITAYNSTVEMAFQTQQLAIASEALTGLGQIYQQNKSIDLAIATYNKLLQIQQQTYNYYGQVNTYDTLGKIYLNINQKAEAKKYFQQGLEIAKSINYKTEYFNNQIQK